MQNEVAIKKTAGYETQRIDQLLDIRIEDLRDDIKGVADGVKDLRKILVGNGRLGLIQRVERNTTRVKILCWLGSVLVAGVLGAYFKDNTIEKIDLSKVNPKLAKEIIELLNEKQ